MYDNSRDTRSRRAAPTMAAAKQPRANALIWINKNYSLWARYSAVTSPSNARLVRWVLDFLQEERRPAAERPAGESGSGAEPPLPASKSAFFRARVASRSRPLVTGRSTKSLISVNEYGKIVSINIYALLILIIR